MFLLKTVVWREDVLVLQVREIVAWRWFELVTSSLHTSPDPQAAAAQRRRSKRAAFHNSFDWIYRCELRSESNLVSFLYDKLLAGKAGHVVSNISLAGTHRVRPLYLTNPA